MSRKIVIFILFVVLVALYLFAQTVQAPIKGVLFPKITSFSSQKGAFSCANGNYNSCTFVDYSGGTHNYIGPMTGYKLWQGGRACDPITGGGALINFASGTSFTLPVSVTFSGIWFAGCHNDPLGDFGAAIVGINGPMKGKPYCHNTTAVAVIIGPTQVPCSEGTITLQPGLYAVLWTVSTTTAGQVYIKSSGNTAPVLMGIQSIGGCTASNGVINFSTPCNIGIQVFVDNSDHPNILLY